jgi:hypothetical protein
MNSSSVNGKAHMIDVRTGAGKRMAGYSPARCAESRPVPAWLNVTSCTRKALFFKRNHDRWPGLKVAVVAVDQVRQQVDEQS